jgi:hypothetical protein
MVRIRDRLVPEIHKAFQFLATRMATCAFLSTARCSLEWQTRTGIRRGEGAIGRSLCVAPVPPVAGR